MSEPLHMPKSALEDLITILWREGFKVLGPVARDGAVAFDEVRKLSDLAVATRETQEPGRYRLVPGPAGEIFGVVNGAGSLKPFFFAPEETLLEINRERRGFKVTEVAPAAPRLAFIGVRACDLAALAVQDRIFLHDRFQDKHYEARRKDAFLVAVNCTRSAATCFCVSMKTGPEASTGFDFSLTELEQGFVMRCGSAAGEAIAAKLGLNPPPHDDVLLAKSRIDECAAGMRRRLDTADLPQQRAFSPTGNTNEHQNFTSSSALDDPRHRSPGIASNAQHGRHSGARPRTDSPSLPDPPRGHGQVGPRRASRDVLTSTPAVSPLSVPTATTVPELQHRPEPDHHEIQPQRDREDLRHRYLGGR